jgi:phage terminase large subunit-like protein
VTLRLPTRYTKPLSESFVTDGDKLIRLAEVAWQTPDTEGAFHLDDWQKWLLRHVLERYPADHAEHPGELRYRQVVISMARQQGKSVIGGLLTGCYGFLMHVPGPNMLSLASSLEQAQIIYDRVLYVVRNNPFMRKRFKRATETRGIITADGSGKYKVLPAKESALQGLPISLCLFDELHLAKKGMWTAAVLGTSARDDGIVIGITTAGDENSQELLDLYRTGERAINGDATLERFGFFVWEAPANAAVDDPEAILAANPAVAAGRLPLDRILSNIAVIPEHEARRYILNQFISGSSQAWIPGQFWANAVGAPVTSREQLVFAVDKTQNWEHASITVSRKDGDQVQTQLIASLVNPTEQKLFDLLVDLYKRYSPMAIALDDRSLPALGKKLKINGYPVWQLWTKEMQAACGYAYAALSRGELKHANDPLINAQVSRGIAKYQGESWLISRRESTGEVDALLATIMGAYVASQTDTPNVQVF